jgi:hypothetical protein
LTPTPNQKHDPRRPALTWLRKGGYVSRAPQKQQELFGELPTIEESVGRSCQDKGLV